VEAGLLLGLQEVAGSNPASPTNYPFIYRQDIFLRKGPESSASRHWQSESLCPRRPSQPPQPIMLGPRGESLVDKRARSIPGGSGLHRACGVRFSASGGKPAAFLSCLTAMTACWLTSGSDLRAEKHFDSASPAHEARQPRNRLDAFQWLEIQRSHD
jgi:hypothetical protein